MVEGFSAQMESLYYYMKSKAADIIAVPTRNSDDENDGPLLLENGPDVPQRDGGLIVVDDTDDRSPKESVGASGHAEWSPQRMSAGKKFADELEGDLVLMTRRGDEYFGRMGVVVRKGVIVDDGRKPFMRSSCWRGVRRIHGWFLWWRKVCISPLMSPNEESDSLTVNTFIIYHLS